MNEKPPPKPDPEMKTARMSWGEHTFWIIAGLVAAFTVGYAEIMWHFVSPGGGGPGFAIAMFQAWIAQAAALIGLIASFLVPGPRSLGILFAAHAVGNLILCVFPLLDGNYRELPFFVVPVLATGAFAWLFFLSAD